MYANCGSVTFKLDKVRRLPTTRNVGNKLVCIGHKRILRAGPPKHVARHRALCVSARALVSLEDAPLPPDIAKLVPADFVLDLDLSPQHLQSAINTAQLNNADSSFSQLWWRSGTIAVAKLRFRADKGLPTLPGTLEDNQLALQCGAFCEQLGQKFELQKPVGRHLDFWIITSLCLKVKL